jgi:hypothetical protein
MITLTKEGLRAWQIRHYTERLKEARTTEEKSFIRTQLFNLKKPSNHGTAAICGFSGRTVGLQYLPIKPSTGAKADSQAQGKNQTKF